MVVVPLVSLANDFLGDVAWLYDSFWSFGGHRSGDLLGPWHQQKNPFVCKLEMVLLLFILVETKERRSVECILCL